MGTIKTTNIETITGSGTLTLGQSGETISIPSGVTFSATAGTMSGQNYPAFKSFLSSNQVITANTLTVLQMNDEVFDEGGYYDVTTYRFTPPAGKYSFMGNVGNGEFEIYLQASLLKNGSSIAESIVQFNSGTWAGRLPVHVIEEANGTDYFELAAQSGDTTILSNNYRTFFSAFRIGD